MMKPHYSQEEADSILRRAIEQEPTRDFVSRERLERIAAELGIMPDVLRQAEADHVAAGGGHELYREFLAEGRGVFLWALFGFVGVNAGLMAINYHTWWDLKWFVFPLLATGYGLYMYWVRAYVRDTQDHVNAFFKFLWQKSKVLPPANGVPSARP